MNTPMQSMYRGYPVGPPQRSPHGSASHAPPSRRGPGPGLPGTHPQAASTSAQIAAYQAQQAQQAAVAQEREFAHRRSRKPTDLNMPDGLEEVVGWDMVEQYKAMQDLERRLDATMMRKRLEIQDAVNRNVKQNRSLRIWISNTVENQPWQDRPADEDTFDFNSEAVPTFKLKIEGRLLGSDDDNDDSESESEEEQEADGAPADGGAMDTSGQDGNQTPNKQGKKTKASRAQPPRKRLSSFFKAIRVEFVQPKMIQPDGKTYVEWKKPLLPRGATTDLPVTADFDVLHFKRKGDQNMNVTISLIRDESPERFRLSPELAELLDTAEDDRASVVMGIWEYVKAAGLQEDDEKRSIRCDDLMRAVFRQDHISFPKLPELVNAHLYPLAPLTLSYTIRVDQAFHASSSSSSSSPQPTIYDVLVPVEDPLRSRMTSFLSSSSSTAAAAAAANNNNNNSNAPNPATTTPLAALASLDEQIALNAQALKQAKARWDFFTAMSRDPAGFLKRWTSSQKRDLEIILGEATRGGGGGADDDDWARRGGGGGGGSGGSNGVWGSDVVRECVALLLAKAARAQQAQMVQANAQAAVAAAAAAGAGVGAS